MESGDTNNDSTYIALKDSWIPSGPSAIALVAQILPLLEAAEFTAHHSDGTANSLIRQAQSLLSSVEATPAA